MMPEQRDGLKHEMNEHIIATMLHLALLDLADEEIDELESQRDLPENLEQESLFYEKHDNTFLDLIEREIRKQKLKRFVKNRVPRFLRSAVIVIALALVGLTTAIAAVPGARIILLEFLVRMESQYTELGFREKPPALMNFPTEWQGAHYPSYIPEGYGLIEIVNTEDYHLVTYSNARNQSLFFGEYCEDAQTNFDTENARIENRKIHGAPAMLSEKDGIVHLSWVIDDTYYLLKYDGAANEVVQIAESVTKAN